MSENTNPQCVSCKHWTRSEVWNYPPKEQKPLNVGICALLGSETLSYYADEQDAQEVVKPAQVGCSNLFTHELFGCIHYAKL